MLTATAVDSPCVRRHWYWLAALISEEQQQNEAGYCHIAHHPKGEQDNHITYHITSELNSNNLCLLLTPESTQYLSVSDALAIGLNYGLDNKTGFVLPK